ncbi:hypothetical protein F4805DRAFT_439332 [Annulohypoxylon moriforme]|nr:hypothetical protein F4805DRAFT_439332 [Annulohypoxylon moriforme]
MVSHAEASIQAQEPSARPKLAQATTTPATEAASSTRPAQAVKRTSAPPIAPAIKRRPIQPALAPAPAPVSVPIPVPAPPAVSAPARVPITAPAPRPTQAVRGWRPMQNLKFPLGYVPAYTGPQNQTAGRKSTTNGQAENKNKRNGFNSTATTAITSRHYASRVAKEEEERRNSYYNILSELDPYKGTPKEFIHLLVKAAMRDEEISKAIRQLNEEKLKNPSSWTPTRPQYLNSPEAQLPLPPNHQSGTPDQRPTQQPQPQLMPNAPIQQQSPVPGYSPQQPPMPQQMPHPVAYYVYLPETPGQPHQVIPVPAHGSPAPNMYPPYPQSLPGAGIPPPPPYATGTPQNPTGLPPKPTPDMPNMFHTLQSPSIPVTPQPISRQPSIQQPTTSNRNEASTRQNTNAARRSNSNDNNLTNNTADSDSNSNTNSYHTAIVIDDASEDEHDGIDSNGGVDINPDEMDLDGQQPGRKEPSCNFTWVVDRAETQLGWTGEYKKESEIRQDTIGQSTAFKLQRLLKKMNAMIDKYVTFHDRVHILTVMREVIMATLDTDSRVGSACRKNAKEYDDTFVEAMGKLSTEHKQGLKTLEGGKWMEELKMLVEEANRQSLFPRLGEVSTLLDT